MPVATGAPFTGVTSSDSRATSADREVVPPTASSVNSRSPAPLKPSVHSSFTARSPSDGAVPKAPAAGMKRSRALPGSRSAAPSATAPTASQPPPSTLYCQTPSGESGFATTAMPITRLPASPGWNIASIRWKTAKPAGAAVPSAIASAFARAAASNVAERMGAAAWCGGGVAGVAGTTVGVAGGVAGGWMESAFSMARATCFWVCAATAKGSLVRALVTAGAAAGAVLAGDAGGGALCTAAAAPLPVPGASKLIAVRAGSAVPAGLAGAGDASPSAGSPSEEASAAALPSASPFASSLAPSSLAPSSLAPSSFAPSFSASPSSFPSSLPSAAVASATCPVGSPSGFSAFRAASAPPSPGCSPPVAGVARSARALFSAETGTSLLRAFCCTVSALWRAAASACPGARPSASACPSAALKAAPEPPSAWTACCTFCPLASAAISPSLFTPFAVSADRVIAVDTVCCADPSAPDISWPVDKARPRASPNPPEAAPSSPAAAAKVLRVAATFWPDDSDATSASAGFGGTMAASCRAAISVCALADAPSAASGGAPCASASFRTLAKAGSPPRAPPAASVLPDARAPSIRAPSVCSTVMEVA